MSEKKIAGLKSGIKWNVLNGVFMIVIKIIRGFIIPKFLAPANYGLFTSIGLFTRYLLFSDFGANGYLNKEISHYHFNKTDDDKHHFANEIFSLIVLSFFLITIYLAVIAFFYEGESVEFYKTALLLLIPAIIFLKIKEFYLIYALGTQNYKVNAIGSIGTDVIALILVVAGIYFYGPIGGVLGMIFVEVILFFYLKAIMPVSFKFIFHKKIFKHVRQMLKQFSVSITDLLAVTIDQWFVLRIFKNAGLGIYSLGLTFGWLMIALARVFLDAVHPKLMATAKTNKCAAIELVNKSLFFYFLACLLVAPFAIYLVETFVSFYLEEYVDGLNVYFIMIFSGMVKGASSLLRIGFIGLDKEKRYIYFTAINIAIFLVGYFTADVLEFSFYYVITLVGVMDGVAFLFLYASLIEKKDKIFWVNVGALLLGFVFFGLYQYVFRSNVFSFFTMNWSVLFLLFSLMVFALVAFKNKNNFSGYIK